MNETRSFAVRNQESLLTAIIVIDLCQTPLIDVRETHRLTNHHYLGLESIFMES